MSNRYLTVSWSEFVLPKPKGVVPHSAEAKLFFHSLPEDLKILGFLQTVTEYYIDRINRIISEKISVRTEDRFDEVLYFPVHVENIQSVNYPLFVLASRSEAEWFEYSKDANQILRKFLEKYSWKMQSDVFNVPQLLENAYGTEFDILVLLDVGYMIFLNKKRSEVTLGELDFYKGEISDLVYSVRLKLMNVT